MVLGRSVLVKKEETFSKRNIWTERLTMGKHVHTVCVRKHHQFRVWVETTENDKRTDITQSIPFTTNDFVRSFHRAIVLVRSFVRILRNPYHLPQTISFVHTADKKITARRSPSQRRDSCPSTLNHVVAGRARRWPGDPFGVQDHLRKLGRQ